MSEQTAAPLSNETYWEHTVISEDSGDAFEDALDDLCADGFEIVNHSTAISLNGDIIYTALARRKAQVEKHTSIHQRKLDRYNESL